MKLYELNCLIKPGVESETSSISNKIQDILSRAQVQIEHFSPVGKVRLGAPVQKHKEAFFVSIMFQGESSVIEQIKKEVSAIDGIMRTLLMETKAETLAQQMQRMEEQKQRAQAVAKAAQQAQEALAQIKEETSAPAPSGGETEAIKGPEEDKKPVRKERKKVELSDIDKKLEEMLNE